MVKNTIDIVCTIGLEPALIVNRTIFGRAGVRDRVSVPMFKTDLGVSVVCLLVSLTGVVFLELLVLIVASVDTELWVRGRYGDPVSGLVVFMTVSGTSGGAFT